MNVLHLLKENAKTGLFSEPCSKLISEGEDTLSIDFLHGTTDVQQIIETYKRRLRRLDAFNEEIDGLRDTITNLQAKAVPAKGYCVSSRHYHGYCFVDSSESVMLGCLCSKKKK